MDIRSARVNCAPIDGFSVRVDPEETLVPALGVSLPDRLARILVQELANHRLRDRMDDIGIRTSLVSIRVTESSIHARRRSDGIERPHGWLLGGNGRGDRRTAR
jgi:hypothetical protein